MRSSKSDLRAGRRAMQAGRTGQAVAHFARAVALAPGNLAAFEELAQAFRADRQPLNALRAFDRVIAAGKATAPTWLATAETFMEVGESAQALDAFAHCLELDPQLAAAHHGLALAAYALGDVDRAAGALAEAIDLDPSLASLASRATLLPGAPAASQQDILEARRALAAELARSSPLAGRPRPGPYRNAKPRLGYLSSHFHNENYMKPVWALLNHHDRERFVLHLFSDSESPALDFPGFRPAPDDRLRHVHDLSNSALAELIAAQSIDVLVDLNSYSTPERLEMFLSPPAPVVATWFNAFATSGFPGIDVLIGDHETICADEEQFYSERVERLPLSYLTFKVTHPAPAVVEPPSLENGFLTFGSLVTQYKITPPVIEVWSAILRDAARARLVLANRALKSVQNAEWLKRRFAGHGIAPDRLTLLPPAPHDEFLKYYDRIDLALDAFPYNGGTTTMEAIWQGVPVLTFDGDRWASRTSQTILRRTHLAEFVAPCAQAMIAQATALANDPESPRHLAELRRTMRDQLLASSACDAAALAAAMEALFLRLLGR